jgi:hypothetical protein
MWPKPHHLSIMREQALSQLSTPQNPSVADEADAATASRTSLYDHLHRPPTATLVYPRPSTCLLFCPIQGLFRDLGVLHTWGRQLAYHPHIHYVVPGGALSKQDDRWHPSRIDFYLPVKAISKIFKAKFRDEMKKSNLDSHIPEEIWNQEWVVNCQAIGAGSHSIKYLAPYVFKVAISNSRIVKVEECKVFFKYKKPNSNRWRTTKLDVMEFIRRFLQHVLPTGFMKVRYYGFLNPSSLVPLERVSILIELAFGFKIEKPKIDIEPFVSPTCAFCGGSLNYITSLPPFKFVPTGAG